MSIFTVSTMQLVSLCDTYILNNVSVKFIICSENWRTRFIRSCFISLFDIMLQIYMIWVGCCISGNIEELVDNPNQTLLSNRKQSWWVQIKAIGTVLRSLDHWKWKVRLNYNNELVLVSATSVRVIDGKEGLPMVCIIDSLFILCYTIITFLTLLIFSDWNRNKQGK